MRAVFDLDDTISIHSNRDYPNAIPIMPVVNKIRQMKNDGWQIVIYTARGQVSCGGNLQEIEKRNRRTVEEWLSRYSVPYDELLFGKPLGDLYVDDKGMSLNDFLHQPIKLLHGGSGQQIVRIGNVVKKNFANKDEVEMFKKWNAENMVFDSPKIHSYIYNSAYMEYIDGVVASDVPATFTEELVQKCLFCKRKYPQEFDIDVHLARLAQNYTGDAKADKLLARISRYLDLSRDALKSEGSFCHGDMILSNCIVKGDRLFFLDARYTKGANSYLLDIAKLRMSLNGYERIFGISVEDNRAYTDVLDRIASEHGIYDIVIALEIMFIFRCYRYKNAEDKKKLIQFALEEERRWIKR